MERVLVEFYSDFGNTRKVAEDLASACHADLDEIQAIGGAEGTMGMVKDILRGGDHLLPEIDTPDRAPSDYEVVVVGVPVHNGEVATPAVRFLRTYGHDLRRVAFYGVGDGADSVEVYRELAELAGKEPVATLGLSEADLTGPAYLERLDGFVERLSRSG